MMKSFSMLLLTVLFAFSADAAKLDSELKFAKEKIQIGQQKIEVEIADTPAKHSHGLMFRKSMPENLGMLFIFDDEDFRAFWMKNTFIPLTIAYISASGEIVDIQDMSPVKSEMEKNPPSYPSTRPAKYALEMNQGWFKKNQVKVGDKMKRN